MATVSTTDADNGQDLPDLPLVTAYARFEWDCECGEVNDVDHDPSGETVACERCGVSSRVYATR